MESDNKAVARRALVGQAMAAIRAVMDKGPSVANLDAAKAELINLASHKEHFTFEDFPLPTDDAMECSYLIHEDDDGEYALYVNSGAPHQYYAPHDHGTAWAVIAGVEGRERHKLYLRRQNAADGECLVEKKGEVIVAAGEAATMQPDGIHDSTPWTASRSCIFTSMPGTSWPRVNAGSTTLSRTRLNSSFLMNWAASPTRVDVPFLKAFAFDWNRYAGLDPERPGSLGKP